MALLCSSRLNPVCSIAAASVMAAVRLSATACSAIFAATSRHLLPPALRGFPSPDMSPAASWGEFRRALCSAAVVVVC